MRLYREGTLPRDCLGDLWMITEISKKGWGTHIFSYDLVRLRDGEPDHRFCKVVHLEYDFVSEVA